MRADLDIFNATGNGRHRKRGRIPHVSKQRVRTRAAVDEVTALQGVGVVDDVRVERVSSRSAGHVVEAQAQVEAGRNRQLTQHSVDSAWGGRVSHCGTDTRVEGVGSSTVHRVITQGGEEVDDVQQCRAGTRWGNGGELLHDVGRAIGGGRACQSKIIYNDCSDGGIADRAIAVDESIVDGGRNSGGGDLVQSRLHRRLSQLQAPNGGSGTGDDGVVKCH